MARWYFLVNVILTSCLVAGQSPKYALRGGDVSLKTGIAGQPDGILWKHNGNKVVEFNGKEQHGYSPFENRITLDWVSAELSITDLRFEDSGQYDLEVDINKELHRIPHQLEVIDKVSKVAISCEMNDGSGSSSANVSGKLVCSAEPRRPQSLMNFEWRSHGNVLPGPELKISLVEEHDEEVYTCIVSNPLSSETATFTAKDCYSEKSSPGPLIAGLICVFLIVCVCVCLGILFCKRRHKACFAKTDCEIRLQPGVKEGADEKSGDNEETKPLIGGRTEQQHHRQQHVQVRDKDTQDEMPPKGLVERNKMIFEQNNRGKTDQLRTDNYPDRQENTASPPSPPVSESPRPLDLNNLGDADAEQHRELAQEGVQQCDLSDSENENEPDLAAVSDQSDVESSIAPEHPEPEEEADEDEKAQPAPASAETSSAAQPLFPSAESSSHMAPKDTAGELKEDADSDQVTNETPEKNVRESDSSGEGERNESDEDGEDKQPPTVPEQAGSETTLLQQDLKLAQEETHTREGNQQEVSQTAKPVSEDGNETDSVGDCKEIDKGPDLYSAASQQPQSPTPASTGPELPDSAPADPDRQEEDKRSRDSDESEGQSDNGEGEAVEEKHEVQFGPKEEKPGNESLSEDTDVQKKDEVVA